MNKSETIRRIYAIVVSVLIVAMGIALICVAAEIYYSGEGPGLYFSPEIVGDRLKKLAIPLLIVIAAIFAGAVFPVFESKAKRTSEETLKKLQRKIPAEGEGEEFLRAQAAYRKMKIIKLSVWCSALAVALGCAIGTLVYLLNTAHFTGSNFGGRVLTLVKVALPCTVASFGCMIAASFVNGYCAKKQIEQIKTMIRFGSKEVALPKELQLLDQVNQVASHNITLWVVRGAVFVLAITFIILGVLNGGANDVLVKAINICRECIGIA